MNFDFPYGDKAYDRLLHSLEVLPNHQRALQALQYSAQLVELAAFDLAREKDPERVSVLVLLSRDITKILGQIVQEIPPGSSFPNAPH